MAKRITVVISQSQSHNPQKRAIEEEIVAGLLGERGIDVTVVPHLYDLKPDGTGMLCLSGIGGDMVVCSWLYPRAARWILDRNGIRGHEGQSLLAAYGEDGEDGEDDADDLDEDDQTAQDDDKLRVIDQREMPRRHIYCLDLRSHNTAEPYIEEIKRIAREQSTETVELLGWINGTPKPAQMQRYLANAEGGVRNAELSSAEGGRPHREASVVSGHSSVAEKDLTTDSGQLTTDQSTTDNARLTTDNPHSALPIPHSGPVLIEEDAPRRWYPVIDFSRCTNCLECIDFCLFGVYGIDGAETILVEQPDNCRKGCPACSRVCPENAIIFPQHKTPTIAGSPEVGAALKIDLSKLFGAPDPGAPGAEKALDVAVRERDEQLMLAGRDMVGMSVGVPKRQANRTQSDEPDDLDNLMDALDAVDL